jgi:hypothetical protein
VASAAVIVTSAAAVPSTVYPIQPRYRVAVSRPDQVTVSSTGSPRVPDAGFGVTEALPAEVLPTAQVVTAKAPPPGVA